MKRALFHSMAGGLLGLLALPAHAGQGAAADLLDGRPLGYALLGVALLGIGWVCRQVRSRAPHATVVPPVAGEFRHGFAASQSQPPVANRATRSVPWRLPNAACAPPLPAAITVAAAPSFAGNPIIARLRQRWGEEVEAGARDHRATSSGE